MLFPLVHVNLLCQDGDCDNTIGTLELPRETAKEGRQKGEQQPNSKAKAYGKNAKQGSQASDSPNEGYVHVRARRGQATNSHSLAERVRCFKKFYVMRKQNLDTGFQIIRISTAGEERKDQ